MKQLILTLATCAFTAAIASAEDKPKDEAIDRNKPALEKIAALPDLTGTSWRLKSSSDKKLDSTNTGIPAFFIMKEGKSCFHADGDYGYSVFYHAKADGSFSVESIVVKPLPSKYNWGADPYFLLLKQVRKHAINGNKLVLSDKDGKELLVFEKHDFRAVLY